MRVYDFKRACDEEADEHHRSDVRVRARARGTGRRPEKEGDAGSETEVGGGAQRFSGVEPVNPVDGRGRCSVSCNVSCSVSCSVCCRGGVHGVHRRWVATRRMAP